MKSKMVKGLAVMLVVVMTFGTVACGNTKGDVATDGSNAQVENQQDGADVQDDANGNSQTDEGAAKDQTQEESKEQSKEESKEEPKEEPKADYDVGVTLQEVFGAHNMKVGTCLNDNMIRDKKSTDFILKNFNSITFENHLKPDAILNQNESKKAGDIVVKFSSTTEKLLEWCKANNMPMRGHTLVWYSQTPSWIFYEEFNTSKPLVSREVMLQRMESYISQVFALLEEKGYLDLFYAYDVVNEAWMEDGSMSDCLWLKTVGEDYLWQAFYLADKYAPEHVELYYNDYNEQFKTDTLYDFVQTLKDEEGNYLIDGIGFQAHLYTEDSQEDYFATMDKLASLGIKISLTELDVCLGSWPVIKPASEENLLIQGQYYYNLINGIFERVDNGTVIMDALTFWGFNDNQSWRRERNPLLLNALFKPKYAYYGALQLKDQAGFPEETE